MGFTLLEVMLAITIFALCMSAIYMSFRTSSHAFETGRRSAEQMQAIRFTLDQITRDLRAIYYETDYNVKFADLEHEAAERQDDLLRKLEQDHAKRKKSSVSGKEEDLGFEYLGTKMNLRFVGEDNEDNDSLEFAHFLPSDGTSDNSFLGAERVRYYLDGENLYRRRSRVIEVMQLNPDLEEDLKKSREETTHVGGKKKEIGDSVVDVAKLFAGSTLLPFLTPKSDVQYFVPLEEKPVPPDLLATNVTAFDVKYGYFFGEWEESDSWDSESKKHRTPPFELDPKDSNFLNKMLAYAVRAPDHLPSYARIRMNIGGQTTEKGEKGPNKVYAVDTMVWIPGAQEGYVPTDLDYFKPAAKTPDKTGEKQENDQ